MWVRTMISEGRLVSALAATMARSSAARSLPSSTRWTCQPYASNRRAVSSENASAVEPSMVIRLSS